MEMTPRLAAGFPMHFFSWMSHLVPWGQQWTWSEQQTACGKQEQCLIEELTGLNIALRKLLVDVEQSTHQIYLEMLNDIFGQNVSFVQNKSI